MLVPLSANNKKHRQGKDEKISKRRAIKQYDFAHRMKAAKIQEVLLLAVLSPTDFNIQNWRFVLPNDQKLRQIFVPLLRG